MKRIAPSQARYQHEFRNCVAALIGNVFLLRVEELPPAAVEAVSRIERIAGSLERLARKDETEFPVRDGAGGRI